MSKPNYFIGLRILFNSPVQQAGLDSLYEEMRFRNRNVGKILSNPNKLHITLALLTIEESRVFEAVQCFQASNDGMRSLLPPGNMTLSFQKVNAFGPENNRNVLFLEPKRDQYYDALMNYCVYISEFFEANNFKSHRHPSPVLHATIANKYAKKMKITERDYLTLDDLVSVLSPVVCTEIDLLKIGSTDQMNGYYQSYSKFYIDNSISSSKMDAETEELEEKSVCKDKSC